MDLRNSLSYKILRRQNGGAETSCEGHGVSSGEDGREEHGHTRTGTDDHGPART